MYELYFANMQKYNLQSQRYIKFSVIFDFILIFSIKIFYKISNAYYFQFLQLLKSFLTDFFLKKIVYVKKNNVILQFKLVKT